MPNYNFMNEETGEQFTEFFKSYEAKQEYLKENPHIKAMVSAVSFIGGVSMDSGRLPDGFKDRMREMKKKHPTSKAVDHLI